MSYYTSLYSIQKAFDTQQGVTSLDLGVAGTCEADLNKSRERTFAGRIVFTLKYMSTIAFCQGKMIHCHLPFVTEKRFCKYSSFLSSKNTCPLSKRKCFASTMPFSNKKILCDHGYFSFSENLMLTWILCEEGKCLDKIYKFILF